MFFIYLKDYGGDAYYLKEYQRLYDRFVFNLSIYAGKEIYRKKVLEESLYSCDMLLKKAIEQQEPILAGVGLLNKKVKKMMEKYYFEIFG